MATAPIFIDQ
jgi:hypothetical protein